MTQTCYSDIQEIKRKEIALGKEKGARKYASRVLFFISLTLSISYVSFPSILFFLSRSRDQLSVGVKKSPLRTLIHLVHLYFASFSKNYQRVNMCVSLTNNMLISSNAPSGSDFAEVGPFRSEFSKWLQENPAKV